MPGKKKELIRPSVGGHVGWKQLPGGPKKPGRYKQRQKKKEKKN